MKPTLILLALTFFLPFTALRAAEASKSSKQLLSALQAADDARASAMRSGNRQELDAIFSSELNYAHSNGEVDTKGSFIEKLTSGKSKYLSMDYEKREFTFPAPGVALMNGRVHVRVATTETTLDTVLSFLAVWRLEQGHWRFLAWQSCKLPPK